MKLTTTERKVNVSPAIHEYAEKKIGKLDRFFGKEAEASIIFSAEPSKSGNDRFKVELTISSGGLVLRATSGAPNIRGAINSAIDAIEDQLRRHKTRLSKRLREGAYEPAPVPDVTFENGEEDEEEPEFKIVRSKAFPIKPMSPEEAILQMNLLDHEFYVFRNQERDEAFSVVYKRKLGDYGIIESLD